MVGALSEPTIEMAVTLVVGGFALAFLRDAWCALRGAASGQSTAWFEASSGARLRGRRSLSGAL